MSYPRQTQPGGYPQQQPGGYPPYQPEGYPPQQPGGYPPYQPEGYPPHQPTYPGYPPAQPGYPSGGDIGFGNFPPQQPGGYPPYQPEGYPPQQHGGYPPHQPGGYPSQQSGGYPPYQPEGYSPQQHGGYPSGNNNSSYPPFNPNAGAPSQNPSLYPYLPGASSDPAPTYNPVNSNYSTQQHYQGTVTENPGFNCNDDATVLYKAMKGLGTDEKKIIDVLCRRTSKQRQDILQAYKAGYGKDLVQNLKSEVSGKFEELCVALLMTPAQLEARDLQKAIDGMGTDESSLIDILCTKTNAQMHELKNAYKTMFKKDMEKAVGGDVSGYFKRFLVSMCAGFRSDNPPDHAKAVQQANELYGAGAKRFGTDEVTFNRIFAVESFPHLRLVCDEYAKLTGKQIESAIKSEMSGYVEEAFLAVVAMARNPPSYFAKRIADTMKGAGTSDRALIRNMVLRSEIDMVQIKQEFQRKYGKSLESYIKSDCSGDYKKGLLVLAGER